MKKQRSGFTLLETALVVAIATLLFMAVAIGFGGRIATNRYDTAASELVDYLRDIYTEALNTENNRAGIEGARNFCTLSSALSGDEKLYIGNSSDYLDVLDSGDEVAFYPGRTNCAIYGKILFFGVGNNSEASKKVHIFDIVGDVATAARQTKQDSPKTSTDLEQLNNKDPIAGEKILAELEYVHADFRAALSENPRSVTSNCHISPAAGYTTYDFDWGTFSKSANFKDENFIGFAMIVRSPLSGDVHTLFYERPSGSEPWDFHFDSSDPGGDVSCEKLTGSSYTNIVNENSPIKLLRDSKEEEDYYNIPLDEKFHTGFCLASDDAYVSIVGRRKFIEFIDGGQNASAVKLEESNTKKDPTDLEKDYNPCI